MIVEVCANSFESAKAAQDAGADRIELCTELSVGGLTPSFGLLEKVLVALTIPVHVLIRPRSGDFTYSEAEVDVMLRDIETCKEFGCDGIVSGALTKDFEIDTRITERLIAATGTMEFTFHRAFDWCSNANRSLQVLKALGVTRLLSSGQQPTAQEGMELLTTLQKDAGGVQIMPGGGINATNCLKFKDAGFQMVHFSATKKIKTLATIPHIKMHSAKLFEEGVVTRSDKGTIREIIEKLKG
ncbi:MAG: copper homeostasis protein CutC [Flavobacteriaceae bacterium]|nr:copper homeostasis protein CutC [Flavobacteriaceae bacterium]|tara:strand:- start:81649 stop:82374 length:726 start_codon:yes stop_codon:yes gene_type:complete